MTWLLVISECIDRVILYHRRVSSDKHVDKLEVSRVHCLGRIQDSLDAFLLVLLELLVKDK